MIAEKIGNWTAAYEDLGIDLPTRIARAEEAMGEPASDVLRRHIAESLGDRWSMELKGDPTGFYIDHAVTLEAAKLKVRAYILSRSVK